MENLSYEAFVQQVLDIAPESLVVRGPEGFQFVQAEPFEDLLFYDGRVVDAGSLLGFSRDIEEVILGRSWPPAFANVLAEVCCEIGLYNFLCVEQMQEHSVDHYEDYSIYHRVIPLKKLYDFLLVRRYLEVNEIGSEARNDV